MDRREDIEGSVGLFYLQPHIAQPPINIIPAFLVRFNHRCRVIVESGNHCILKEGIQGDNHILVDFGCMKAEFLICQHITAPPAGHSVGFGIGLADDNLVPDILILNEARCSFGIDDLIIDVIAQNEDWLALDRLINIFQGLPVVDASRRIIGRGQDDTFCFGSNGTIQLFLCNLKIRGRCVDGDYPCLLVLDDLTVHRIGWYRNDNLIAGIQHRKEGRG